MNLEFYKNKKVFVTGHSGFKGIWLSKILIEAGAKVCGYSLPPESSEILFKASGIEKSMMSCFGDIRDYNNLKKVFDSFQPEIVFHLAAQPLVIDSYEDPRYTYETNVMGTVNLCECVRQSDYVKSFLNITTDKVYKNKEWEWGYRENEQLDGHDPYSNSKSCSELVTHCYINSFYDKKEISASTARAGNVIGGGDFSKNRIIPDCVRKVLKNETIIVRNPNSIRPYQHVLEPIYVYLLIAMKQYNDSLYAGFYNVGPNDNDCISTGKLADLFCKFWGNDCHWENVSNNGPHEANYLKLDCSKIKNVFNWSPRWNVEYAILQTVLMYKALSNHTGSQCMIEQINDFFNIRG